MFCKDAEKRCQAVTKITDQGVHRCLNPANVCLVTNSPDGNPVTLCPDCARKLAIEILDSVPAGRLDADVMTAKRQVRG